MSVNSHSGRAFEDDDVAAAYAYRPPYPDQLFTFLRSLPARRRRALDLGCGPGKIAHRLAESFEHVDAVDPSLAMLRLADDGRHDNINWIPGRAETVELASTYDLVTAGASIHWMDHGTIFSRLASRIAPDGFIAVVEGDDAHDPPWQLQWEAFLRRWLCRLGHTYDPEGFRARMNAFRSWIDIAGERSFVASFSQPVERFVECQHSRATWSRSSLGQTQTAQFDSELAEILKPHAINGIIEFRTRTSVIWGKPRLAHG